MSALDDAYDEIVREREIQTRCKTCRFLAELDEDLAESLSRMLVEGRPPKTIARALTKIGHPVSDTAVADHRSNRHSNVRPR